MDLDMTTRQLYNADLGSFVVFCSTLNIDLVNSSPSLTFVNVIEVALPFEQPWKKSQQPSLPALIVASCELFVLVLRNYSTT